jgi:hypothetical protein
MFELPYWKVFTEGYTASWLETVFLCAFNVLLIIAVCVLFMLWRKAVKQLKDHKEFTNTNPRRSEQNHLNPFADKVNIRRL